MRPTRPGRLGSIATRLLGLQVVDLEITNRCNLACPICPRALRRPAGGMTRGTFEALFARPLPARIRVLRISGYGEPLVHPEALDFAAALKARNPRVSIELSTNGVALDEARGRRLVAAGIDQVNLSLPGPAPENFGTMTGGADVERWTANARRLVRMAAGGRPRVGVHAVVTAGHERSIPDVARWLRGLGIDDVEFFRCHHRGGELGDRSLAAAGPVPGGPCQAAATILFVSWEGQVLVCAHDIHGRHVIGDLRGEPWAAVLRRKAAWAAQAGRLPVCRECNDELRSDLFDLAGRRRCG
jgi:pyruvate-formate lyase-activating enzyme